MGKKTINEVLADNLAYFMEKKGYKQASLGKKVGLAQRTIGNYLSLGLRKVGSTGKEPSAKLGEVEKIAIALGVEVWELLRPLTPMEREFYSQVEELFRKMRTTSQEQAQTAKH